MNSNGVPTWRLGLGSFSKGKVPKIKKVQAKFKG